MLFFLFSLLGFADEPAMTIIVTDSPYEEIYFEEPKVVCTTPCVYEQDTSLIFVEANRKHRTWLKTGKVSGIYNDETIKYAYDGCNFKSDPHGCTNKNGLWLMRTTIIVTEEKASINVMLFDETAVMIGQGTFTRFKKTKIVDRKKVTQQQVPGTSGLISQCNTAAGSCATVPFKGQGQFVAQEEDLEPVVIDIAPTLLDRDIGQTMIYVYDSVR